MLFIVWERIKWGRSLKTRDFWLLLESRPQTYYAEVKATKYYWLWHLREGAPLRWIFSDVFPKNPLPLSKRFCSLPLYAPSAMRCSRATCAWVLCPGYFALGRMCPSTQSIIQAYIDQWRSNWCRQDCQHNGTHYLSCSLSKNSWISSDIMNFISINMVKHIFKVICSTYLLQPHNPHETISKNFIPRRSQIPNQVRPQEERSSRRSPEAAPAQYAF
jgi:hypothetical protein